MGQINEEMDAEWFQCQMENLIDKFKNDVDWQEKHKFEDWLDSYLKWLKRN